MDLLRFSVLVFLLPLFKGLVKTGCVIFLDVGPGCEGRGAGEERGRSGESLAWNVAMGG